MPRGDCQRRGTGQSVDDLDASLRKLVRLKDDGLLTEQEYEQKRGEIMQRRS